MEWDRDDSEETNALFDYAASIIRKNPSFMRDDHGILSPAEEGQEPWEFKCDKDRLFGFCRSRNPSTTSVSTPKSRFAYLFNSEEMETATMVSDAAPEPQASSQLLSPEKVAEMPPTVSRSTLPISESSPVAVLDSLPLSDASQEVIPTRVFSDPPTPAPMIPGTSPISVPESSPVIHQSVSTQLVITPEKVVTVEPSPSNSNHPWDASLSKSSPVTASKPSSLLSPSPSPSPSTSAGREESKSKFSLSSLEDFPPVSEARNKLSKRAARMVAFGNTTKPLVSSPPTPPPMHLKSSPVAVSDSSSISDTPPKTSVFSPESVRKSDISDPPMPPTISESSPVGTSDSSPLSDVPSKPLASSPGSGSVSKSDVSVPPKPSVSPLESVTKLLPPEKTAEIPSSISGSSSPVAISDALPISNAPPKPLVSSPEPVPKRDVSGSAKPPPLIPESPSTSVSDTSTTSDAAPETLVSSSESVTKREVPNPPMPLVSDSTPEKAAEIVPSASESNPPTSPISESSPISVLESPPISNVPPKPLISSPESVAMGDASNPSALPVSDSSPVVATGPSVSQLPTQEEIAEIASSASDANLTTPSISESSLEPDAPPKLSVSESSTAEANDQSVSQLATPEKVPVKVPSASDFRPPTPSISESSPATASELSSSPSVTAGKEKSTLERSPEVCESDSVKYKLSSLTDFPTVEESRNKLSKSAARRLACKASPSALSSGGRSGNNNGDDTPPAPPPTSEAA